MRRMDAQDAPYINMWCKETPFSSLKARPHSPLYLMWKVWLQCGRCIPRLSEFTPYEFTPYRVNSYDVIECHSQSLAFSTPTSLGAMGRPKNDRPSRTNESLAAAKRRYRVLFENSTSDRDAFSELLETLYGHKLENHRITRLDNLRIEKQARVVTSAEECALLLERIKHLDGTVEGVMSGNKHIENALLDRFPGLLVTTLDKDKGSRPDIVCDFLDPSSYKHLRRGDWIVSSPQFDIMDATLPLILARAKRGAFVHVAGDYLTNMPDYRRDFVTRLRDANLLHVVDNLPIPKFRKGVKRCQWLLVFKNARWKRETLVATK
jgi:hypothetical protein